MKRSDYETLERYMLDCMTDSAHDSEHIYRVLFVALDIARFEEGVDADVLIAACLLHDIGRREQFENTSLEHALVGAERRGSFCWRRGLTRTSRTGLRAALRSTATGGTTRPAPSRRRSCSTPTRSTSPARWESPEHSFTPALSASRCIPSIRRAMYRGARRANRRRFSGSTGSNWKSSTTAFSRRGEGRSPRSAGTPPPRFAKACTKRFGRRANPERRCFRTGWNEAAFSVVPCPRSGLDAGVRIGYTEVGGIVHRKSFRLRRSCLKKNNAPESVA